MEFLATTLGGLGGIAIEEAGGITGRKAKIKHEGLLRFKGRREGIFKLNYLPKTLHRVLIPLSCFEVDRLEDVYRKCKETDFPKNI